MAGRTWRSYAPLGSVLTIVSDTAAPVDAIASSLGEYPASLDIGGEVTVRIRMGSDGTDDPGWPAVTAEFADGLMTVRCGSSVAIVDHARGHADMVLTPSLIAIGDAVRLFVEAAFTAVHVAHRRLHAIHSALVADAGVGMLLRGPSGAGKSTITYSCLRRAMTVVSDDWVYANARCEPGLFAGYPWRMMLTEQAAARFPELSGVKLVAHTSAEGWKVPIVPPIDQRQVVHVVDAVIMLDADQRLALDEIGLDEARARFWDASLPSEREHLDREWIDRLLDRPTYVLQRGTSPDDAGAVLAELAASLAGSRGLVSGAER